MVKGITLCFILLINAATSMRMVRQVQDAEQRLREDPPQVCCRCIDQGATCNNDMGNNKTSPGINCNVGAIECDLFEDCDPKGCKVQGLNIVDVSELLNLRQKIEPSCPSGQKICCNPGPGGGFEKGLIPFVDDIDNTLEDVIVDTVAICEDPKLGAVQDFDHGITCGKRDSRVYYDADLEEGFTNPGEWPWAVLIFKDGVYIGAGAMMENDVVVTAGHKVVDYVSNPRGLTVRLGDWNPNKKDRDEEFPHIVVPVECVKVHPDADLRGSLANNVAVLKLRSESTVIVKPTAGTNDVFNVVNPRKGPRRPANSPEGVHGSSVVKGVSSLDVALGLVSEVPGSVIGLRAREIPRSYINTVCLPRNEGQFQNHQEKCWVAAWGNDLKRQREVDLPLVNKAECERRLGPVFRDRGVPNWTLKRSEVCAGGVPGKDACEGEGGAPLVCYDKSSDQYFAVGLVNYGFDCNTDKPAVYTNLGDPSVQQFIISAFRNNNFC